MLKKSINISSGMSTKKKVYCGPYSRGFVTSNIPLIIIGLIAVCFFITQLIPEDPRKVEIDHLTDAYIHAQCDVVSILTEKNTGSSELLKKRQEVAGEAYDKLREMVDKTPDELVPERTKNILRK